MRSVIEDRTRFPLDGSFSGELLDDRMKELERESQKLVAMFSVAGYWTVPEQADLWIRGLQALSNFRRPDGSVIVPFESIRRYPALLAVYAFGIAAVASGRLATLGMVLTRPQVRRSFSDKSEPFVVAVNTSTVLDFDFQRRLPSRENRIAPFSDRLWWEVGLGDALSGLIIDPDEFTTAFDRFEYLAAMVGQDLHGWAPLGCFVWRARAFGGASRSSTALEVERELEQEGGGWDLLNSGAFDRDVQRALQAKAEVDRRFRS